MREHIGRHGHINYSEYIILIFEEYKKLGKTPDFLPLYEEYQRNVGKYAH